MLNKDVTKEQLIKEIDQLKSKISELEKTETMRLSKLGASKDEEKALKQSEEKFRKAFSINPDSLNINRLNDGMYISVNEGFTKIMGYSEDEVIGKTSLEINIWKNPEDRKKLLHELKKKGKVENLRAKFRAKNGELKDGLMSAVIIEINGIAHILNLTKDITEQLFAENAAKQTEKELKESEKKYKDLFEKSKDAILIIQNGKFVDCNKATIKMLRFNNKNEFLNTHPSELSPEKQPDGKLSFAKANEMMGIAFKNGSHRFEWEHKKSDGEIFPVEVLLTVIENNENNQILYTVWRDITDRKKAEKELRHSEARFKRLFEDLGDAVFVTRIGKENMGEIVEANPAAVRQTGYSRNELLQMNIIYDLAISGTGGIDTSDWNEKLYAGKMVTTIEKKRRKDGSEFWTEVIVTPIEFKGEMASLSINHDITSHKQAQDSLKKSEEHFRAMFENTSIGFYRTTPEGEILYANPALVTMLGYKDFDELAKRNLKQNSFDIVNSRNEILDMINRQGYSKGYESIWKVKDNRTISIRENTKAYYNQDGKIIYYEGTIEDITEEKKAELLLKESEEKYRTLIDNIQDGVFLIDEGKIIFANDAFAKIIGYSTEEVLGEYFNKYIAPEDVREVINNYLKGMKGESGPSKYEFRALHKDGLTSIFVNMTVDLINYENRLVAIGTVKDVSENKKMQELLSIREKYYRALFDLSPSGIVLCDTKGNILDVNESFCKYHGYTPSELQGKNVKLLAIEDRHLEVEMDIQEILKGKTLQHEVINVSKDGSLRNIELHDTLVTLPDGQLGLLSIANDITERTRTAQIQSVIYKISNAVNLTDNLDELISIIREGLGTLLDTTNFFVAIYEEETDTILLPYIADEKDTYTSFPAGKSLTAHVIKSKKSLFGTKKVIADLESRGEIEAVGSDSEIWMGVPMILKGKATGAIVVQSYDDENAFSLKDMEILEFVSQAISISISRKKAESDLLKALEKATESDRLKSAFLATVSHELRTPLNAIIGFSEIIDDEMEITEILSFNKTINASGMHLLGIVEDIFDISLIETGEVQINKKEENLESILKNIHEIIEVEQQNTNKNNIKINQIIPSDKVDLVIYTDPLKLKQILINLLKNALKFTNEGHINYGYSIESIKDKQMFKFYVEDSGIGIPKEKQSIIFDMFRQVEDSHTRIYGGTGIGLSISKKLAELLGGQLWVESDEGAGAVFYFTIPLENHVIESNTRDTITEADIYPEHKTILVVEDDMPSFEFLKIVLERSGYSILWAKDGLEAIKYCTENYDINLVFMDINMPAMNGYDATIEIKKIRPELIIIAQTAYAISGDREKALEAGCDDYMSKPIKKTELLEIIRRTREINL